MREPLIHVLTEAAEIEHNLLCSYLHAAFSLKRGAEEGLTPTEAVAVSRWRKSLMSVALEEMAHVALVNNLLVFIGGAPHFNRPNFPPLSRRQMARAAQRERAIRSRASRRARPGDAIRKALAECALA